MSSRWTRWCVRSACVVVFVSTAPVYGQEVPAGAKSATLVVRLPADARLEIDGTATRQTGSVRRFQSPPLEPGKKYVYVVTALIEPNNYTKITRTRKVTVTA